ncbi:MAG: HlyD family efflux transporter periplasmic adaptor subunit [Marinilabiliales bacterium]|nr:HlyD family efflux transporter periplasmic adaptor subunit [Marinilabiliales bacterium]
MRLTKKKITIFSGAFVLLILVIFFIGKAIKNSTLYRVKRENFEAIISCKGEIQSEKAILINMPDVIGDRQLEIWDIQIKDLIPEGSIVKQGDYVALLDQGRIKQLKEKNEETLKKLIFNYNDEKIDSAVDLVQLRNGLEQFVFDLDQKKLDMEQSIYESPAYQRKAKMAYERAQRQLEARIRAYRLTQNNLRTKVHRFETQIDEFTTKDTKYQQAFDQARITAPRDGMLIYGRTYGRGGSRKLTVGSYVSRQTPTIATLPDLSILNSETYVEEIYVPRIHAGDSARVFIDALKNMEMAGIISSISNVGQEMAGFESKVFKVNIRVSSAEKKIKPAMTTNNEIIISREPNVLVIPRQALFREDARSFVYQKDYFGYHIQDVTCGSQNEKLVVITAGLKEGDRILLNKPEE